MTLMLEKVCDMYNTIFMVVFFMELFINMYELYLFIDQKKRKNYVLFYQRQQSFNHPCILE